MNVYLFRISVAVKEFTSLRSRMWRPAPNDDGSVLLGFESRNGSDARQVQSVTVSIKVPLGQDDGQRKYRNIQTSVYRHCAGQPVGNLGKHTTRTPHEKVTTTDLPVRKHLQIRFPCVAQQTLWGMTVIGKAFGIMIWIVVSILNRFKFIEKKYRICFWESPFQR